MPRRATISTLLLRPLEQALPPAARGAFYAAADVTPEMIADADARVSPAQFCVAWAEAARLSADPALALAITLATPPGAFGIVEYVCRSAPTLGQALSLWVRYLGILDDAVRVELSTGKEGASLRVVQESEAPAPASHELCFALVVRNARLLLAGVGGAFPVRAVRYTHRVARDVAARHDAFFGVNVAFGADVTELVFAPEALDLPLATADANLFAVLLPAAEAQRAKEPDAPPLTEQVRRALRTGLVGDDPQLEAVAKRLGLTGRSLQRRLRDEGTSYQAERDAVRRELADAYLGRGMSFAEISFLLGFSEPSAFFRAFKRWTGRTPLEQRESLRGAPA